MRPTQRVRSVVEAPPEGARGGCVGDRWVTVSVPYNTMELSPAATNRNARVLDEVRSTSRFRSSDSPLHIPSEQGCVARSLPPAQYLPPFLGAGLLQSRLRYWMQSALHDDHDDHDDHLPSTEGQTTLQPFFCTGAPSHAGPPFTGAGLSHSRVRLRTPRPHLALQGVQSDHSPHCPGTASETDIVHFCEDSERQVGAEHVK